MPTTQWFRDRIAALEAQVIQLQAALVIAQAGVESAEEQAAEQAAKESVESALAAVAELQQQLQEARDELALVTAGLP